MTTTPESIDSLKRRHVPCNLCGADDAELVMETEPIRGVASGTKVFASTCDYIGREKLVRCKKCKLMYFDPQLQPEVIVDGYTEVDDTAYVAQAEGRLVTFESCWKAMQPYLPADKGRVLDIGAAAGYFLKVAQDHGWEAHGVEPNRGLREYAQKNLGVTIEAPTIEAARFPDALFDVVTLWDVIEHITDPMAALREAHRVLKPGGLLVVNYPDISDPFARAFGKRWWFLLSAHLYYFTPRTITIACEKAGFDVLGIGWHFQKLPFGYLVQRLQSLSPLLSSLMAPPVRILGLSQWLFPYYASQRRVIARKKA